MANSLPERWLEYKPVGDVIKDTQILAFKVPLKEAIVKNLEPEQRFTTTKLLQAFPRLKYIVDLTNTFRYYDKKEFTDVGVKYEKIAIPGRKIPPMSIIKRFFKVMDDFTSACGQDELIGIHCTHGVNRTGYLICRYLVQQLGWEIQDSLKAFGEARGYPIERDIYLAALKEVQRGEKIDTSNIVLQPTNIIEIPSATKKEARLELKPSMGVMGPPGFAMSRRGAVNGALFPPQRYGFAGPPPGFRPMPPPPGWPPLPPPMDPPLYGPRPHRYGMPMRPTLPTPPGPPGFPLPGFPLRMPGPPRMAGPPRLPPAARLPLPKIPPPPPPPPPHSRTAVSKQLQKKKQIRNGMIERAVRLRRNVSARILSKMRKEQDFTVDTFEENLLTSSGTSQLRRRPMRGRYSQAK